MTTTETDLQSLVGSQFRALADALDSQGPSIADASSLCVGWTISNVVAHLTMAARYDGPAFMAELASAGYDFDVLSEKIARRDGALPLDVLINDLRSSTMAVWAPPSGGATAALTHIVIHGLDITAANDLERTTSDRAATIVLAALTEGGVSAHFGIDPTGLLLRATDLDWKHGHGTQIDATASDLVLALAGRARPGINLPAA